MAVAAAALITPAAALAHDMRFGLFMGPGEFQSLGLSQQQQQSLLEKPEVQKASQRVGPAR